MTYELAVQYVPRRMAELGYEDYAMRMRHFVLQPLEKIEIEAWNELFILPKESCEVRITSDFGLFDLSAENINELQYEHQGLITVQNLSETITHIQFIQVIPKSHGNPKRKV